MITGILASLHAKVSSPIYWLSCIEISTSSRDLKIIATLISTMA
jgi:hypothetical protein